MKFITYFIFGLLVFQKWANVMGHDEDHENEGDENDDGDEGDENDDGDEGEGDGDEELDVVQQGIEDMNLDEDNENVAALQQEMQNVGMGENEEAMEEDDDDDASSMVTEVGEHDVMSNVPGFRLKGDQELKTEEAASSLSGLRIGDEEEEEEEDDDDDP